MIHMYCSHTPGGGGTLEVRRPIGEGIMLEGGTIFRLQGRDFKS